MGIIAFHNIRSRLTGASEGRCGRGVADSGFASVSVCVWFSVCVLSF